MPASSSARMDSALPVARYSSMRRGAKVFPNGSGPSSGVTNNYYTLPSDEFWGRMKAAYSDREIVELSVGRVFIGSSIGIALFISHFAPRRMAVLSPLKVVLANLPEGAESFTTIELKSNFVGTKRGGAIRCDAKLVHGGRTTQAKVPVAAHQ